MCGVACAPVLRALVGARRAECLEVALQTGNRGRTIEVSRIGGSSKNKNKTKIAYANRALMLRLPVPLLRTCGTLTPPDN